jgi:Ger(x)C family germination protein
VNKKYKRKIFFAIILTIIFTYSFIGSKGEMVENLDIPIGVGYDSIGEGYYRTSISMYEFGLSEEVTSRIVSGQGKSIGGTVEERQTKANKKFLQGLEKIYIIGEGLAENGIHNIIDVLLNNPKVNDRSPAVIYSGKAEELLNHKVKGYANSAEYVSGIIKNSIYYNFFSNQFSMIDIIVRVDAEGRNVVLPYIELKEEGPEITGLAIFKGDKMIGKTTMEEARIINLLKFNGGRGILTLQQDLKKYINFYAETKRKVKCTKVNGKYNFVINIKLTGNIVSNELNDNIIKDSKALKEFEKNMERSIKKSCTKYINKAKYEYKTDIWDLGREASAKYGRHTGVDWNKVVSEANIEVNVNVNVKVKDEGRGLY